MFARNPMNPITVIATDLVTPLGAYLRLRPGGEASFLLESVKRGRRRDSFVGTARAWSGSRRQDAASPSSATSPTTMRRGSEPTVQLPDTGPTSRRAGS